MPSCGGQTPKTWQSLSYIERDIKDASNVVSVTPKALKERCLDAGTLCGLPHCSKADVSLHKCRRTSEEE
jgi:hypothetical protein